MGQFLGRIFLWPGNAVCDACNVRAGDDRMMIRTLVNMLFWNLFVVITAVLIF